MPLFKLNESIETVAHNAIGNFLMGDHTLGTKKWISSIDPRLIPNGIRDKHDQEYFRKYYRITPAVESKLRQMIKDIPNVAVFGKTKGYKSNDIFNDYYGSNAKVEDQSAMLIKHKANEVSLGTATAYKILNYGDKFAIVFFIFDSKGIDSAKVITAKSENKYDATVIPGFKSIKPSEYENPKNKNK